MNRLRSIIFHQIFNVTLFDNNITIINYISTFYGDYLLIQCFLFGTYYLSGQKYVPINCDRIYLDLFSFSYSIYVIFLYQRYSNWGAYICYEVSTVIVKLVFLKSSFYNSVRIITEIVSGNWFELYSKIWGVANLHDQSPEYSTIGLQDP